MTDPFLTTDTDIRGMHSFLMNAPKLLGSITWQIASGDEAKAAVTLWAQLGPPLENRALILEGIRGPFQEGNG